jgi:hypothetical protein
LERGAHLHTVDERLESVRTVNATWDRRVERVAAAWRQIASLRLAMSVLQHQRVEKTLGCPIGIARPHIFTHKGKDPASAIALSQ